MNEKISIRPYLLKYFIAFLGAGASPKVADLMNDKPTCIDVAYSKNTENNPSEPYRYVYVSIYLSLNRESLVLQPARSVHQESLHLEVE